MEQVEGTESAVSLKLHVSVASASHHENVISTKVLNMSRYPIQCTKKFGARAMIAIDPVNLQQCMHSDCPLQSSSTFVSAARLKRLRKRNEYNTMSTNRRQRIAQS
eukprot:3443513-Amphidinium_carterae.1